MNVYDSKKINSHIENACANKKKFYIKANFFSMWELTNTILIVRINGTHLWSFLVSISYIC